MHPITRHIANHVIPTEQNGFVPHILKAPALWSILGIAVGLFGFSHILHTTNYLNISAEVYPATIVTLTNQDRSEQGLTPLAINPTLQAAAVLKANDMVANNYFAHTSPAGINPWHWFAQVGYKFLYAGENLAVNFNESGDVETAWLNSPTHRANVLSPHYTEMGVAVAQGSYKGNYTTYVVELFGTPAMTKGVATEISPLRPTLAKGSSTTKPRVAGAAAEAPQLLTINESPDYISVQNTDQTLQEAPITESRTPHVSWWSRAMLQMDRYIGAIIEIIIVALIIALATLVSRERERHHRLHMAYGILMVIILTSALFIGRIGVFAESAPVQPFPYLQY